MKKLSKRSLTTTGSGAKPKPANAAIHGGLPESNATVKPLAKAPPGTKLVLSKSHDTSTDPTLIDLTDDEMVLRDRLHRAQELVNGFALSAREKLFVVEYSKDQNGTQAAIRAGYSPRGADVTGIRMLGNARVKLAIDAVMNDRIEQGIYDGDKLVAHWIAISKANPNDLTQHRRLNCRYCWGSDHRYQFTPMEMAEECGRQKHANAIRKAKGEDELPFDPIGGLGYRGNRDPHPECPECWGEGIGRPFFTDTRKLGPESLPLYAGVKQTKDGLEIQMHSQADALDKLARYFGLYKDKLAEAIEGNYTKEALDARFAGSLQAAKERQRLIDEERGTATDG